MSAVEGLNKTTGYTPETKLATIEATRVYHERIAYYLYSQCFQIFISNH